MDECIERAGGVAKFQFKAFTMIVLGMICGAFILYSIVYFAHIPKMLCRTVKNPVNWTSCDIEDACNSVDTLAYKPDPDDVETMTNWISTMDLYCLSSLDQSLIGSMFFVGTFTGSFVLPRAADIYGRKPLFLIGLALYIGVVISLYFCSNLFLLYVLLYLGGVSETGRYYVAYVYTVEMMPARVQDKAGLYIFMVFGFVMVYIAAQFSYITKDCYVNNFIALGLALLSWVLVAFWLPESPRFLYSHKKFRPSTQRSGYSALRMG